MSVGFVNQQLKSPSDQGMLSKLFVRKSLTKRNEFPFVEALGLYQKQIIHYRNVSLSFC
jgi:hypothetical protein